MKEPDIHKIKSHPDKLLSTHIKGIIDKSESSIHKKISEIVAIFHDLGKMNPNFQKKLTGEKVNGYSSHAYLSALSWIIFCQANYKNLKAFGINNDVEVIYIAAIIAHHHGNLPNLRYRIFNDFEFDRLKDFLIKNNPVPIHKYLIEYNPKYQKFESFNIRKDGFFLDAIGQQSLIRDKFLHGIENPLEIYLEIKSIFSRLIKSDKADAGSLQYESQKEEFRKVYSEQLNQWIKGFPVDSELNKIRTKMRNESEINISTLLSNKKDQRIFSLTAPTGAGKTAMLLSLANCIMKEKGEYRIIYILPFLSITEQVYNICDDNWKNMVQRIDSKAENKKIQKLQKTLDNQQDESKIREILSENFKEATFEYPFIVTTFVRFFETLLSNKNATLLKFPNFSNSIFLIDEIQALPPRLYSFFAAFLDVFCKKFDSYAVLSTATMPDFTIPVEEKIVPKKFFGNYQNPPELLDYKYFNETVFQRYTVQRIMQPIELETLTENVLNESKSTLIILNTISDSKELFSKFYPESSEEKQEENQTVYLLNTHFTTGDRQRIIETVNRKLKQGNQKIILISTQLIEAGVDIDFPVVYRDLCPLPSLIQSAGRCNRNNSMTEKGKVVLFEFIRDGKKRWQYIYRGLDRAFVNDTLENIGSKPILESELFKSQKKFFEKISQNTVFARYKEDSDYTLVEKIKELAFEDIGEFRLIDNDLGEENSYYVAENNQDKNYGILKALHEKIRTIPIRDFNSRKMAKLNIETQLKNMAKNVVRVRGTHMEFLTSSDPKNPCFNLHLLAPEFYSPTHGILKSDCIL